MDWGELASELRKAEKLYRVFEQGAAAAEGVVGAEHYLGNLQGEAKRVVEDLSRTQEDLVLIRQEVAKVQETLRMAQAAYAELGPKLQDLTARVKVASEASQQLAKAITADKVLQASQQDEATQRLASVEAERSRVLDEIKRLHAIRDRLKADLAQVS